MTHIPTTSRQELLARLSRGTAEYKRAALCAALERFIAAKTCADQAQAELRRLDGVARDAELELCETADRVGAIKAGHLLVWGQYGISIDEDWHEQSSGRAVVFDLSAPRLLDGEDA